LRAGQAGSAPDPADTATPPGSGFNLYISPANAARQAARVAAAGGLPPERVRFLVGERMERTAFGSNGEPRVDLLLLNLALDALR
jgi:K+-transporting ATPase ATPase C chain